MTLNILVLLPSLLKCWDCSLDGARGCMCWIDFLPAELHSQAMNYIFKSCESSLSHQHCHLIIIIFVIIIIVIVINIISVWKYHMQAYSRIYCLMENWRAQYQGPQLSTTL